MENIITKNFNGVEGGTSTESSKVELLAKVLEKG
ncbi:hypothetical protein E2C01_056710 [Portunus trituberculatus]|uniref:Uncharacterized protein n=1 Tax=Portunus trituberculatus TaxID=210409 RepID=A0A5B7GR35_PORTR|nr:hypothetical protein [Portunus trituberculatus]